jgi:hypothetical protein
MSETIETAGQPGTVDEDLRDVAAPAYGMQDDGAEGADEQDEAKPEEIEEIELSFGAKTLKVAKSAIPDDVRAELEDFTRNIQGDYTRKTQEVAEQRKEVELQRELYGKLQTLGGEARTAFYAGEALLKELQQLEQIDLRQLRQSNPDQARWISDEIAIKRGEFNRQVNAVSHYEQAMTAEEQRAVATLAEAGRARIAKTVRGFDQAAERQMIEYAVKAGISEQDAQKWPLNPITAEFAWKAMQYDKLHASTKAATAAKHNAAPSAPVRAVSGKSTGASVKSPEQMSDDEYYRWEMSKTVKAMRR